MAGTRTAPAVNGTPQFTKVSISFVDASGDYRSVSAQIAADSTNAQIEAFVDNFQDYSNASVYKVKVEQVYNSAPQRTQADASVYPSVYDNVVILYKTADNRTQDLFIPAPNNLIIPDNQDTPDVVAVQAFNLAALTVLNGGGITYAAVSARFTERREKNQSVLV